MARRLNRLNARSVVTIKKPGRHADGSGLYLVVDKSGAKRWVFLFRQNGRLREMGLGGLTSVGLADARKLAEDCRRNLASGLNPIEVRKAIKRAPSFGECADEFLADMSKQWRNEKHRWQWKTTLTDYTSAIRSKPVNAIETEDILGVLKPLWETIHETATRLRGRIERVLDAAKAKGYRSGENPARWSGHLDNLLPMRHKLTRGHLAAMAYKDVPAFIAQLRERDSLAAPALEFTILTAARSGEVLGMKWDEIDVNDNVWNVPADRMKAGRPHRVPLSPRAVEIIENMRAVRTSDYVFPGRRDGRPLSLMAMQKLLRGMSTGLTTHGFRSSFRDWCGELTGFPREIAEAALAHVVGDETERAYRRGDALEKRRRLMIAWAAYCEPRTKSNVVPMVRTG